MNNLLVAGEAEFQLDPRLCNDTVLVTDLALCRLLLMNDSRWPWLILVPRVSGAVEWHDLDQEQRVQSLEETVRVSTMFKSLSGCTKINTASLGNVVSQLHIHVVARNPGDPNWPAPVWGFGERIPYPNAEMETFSNQINQALSDK